ncbi:MAG: translesion DNA synthesis-associated protein ImuA [Rubrivivax sp.]|nr:translesion DNA synthesis-associated protein ImuA [Rubrivivax sp.]
MSAVLSWAADDGLPAQSFVHASRSRPRRSAPGELPPEVEQAVWRGSDLGHASGTVVSSGFAALDAELPGGGWPTRGLTEVLSPQPSVLEWRLIGPALQGIVAAGGHIVVIGPPKTPHLPGLRHCGIDERHLVWVQADAPAERLWCTEQLIKSGACGAIVSWLPQARPEQIRRLQVCAQSCEGPVFLFRPAAAQHEASAAPLRVFTTFGIDWALQVQVLKRRGPAHDGVVTLPSVPGGLQTILTPRLLRPSQLLAARTLPREPVHALGSNAPAAAPRRSAAVR